MKLPPLGTYTVPGPMGMFEFGMPPDLFSFTDATSNSSFAAFASHTPASPVPAVGEPVGTGGCAQPNPAIVATLTAASNDFRPIPNARSVGLITAVPLLPTLRVPSNFARGGCKPPHL